MVKAILLVIELNHATALWSMKKYLSVNESALAFGALLALMKAMPLVTESEYKTA